MLNQPLVFGSQQAKSFSSGDSNSIFVDPQESPNFPASRIVQVPFPLHSE